MSELTRCNYCTLQSIRERANAKGQSVAVIQATLNFEDWIEVEVDGKRVVSFKELSDHCVC